MIRSFKNASTEKVWNRARVRSLGTELQRAAQKNDAIVSRDDTNGKRNVEGRDAEGRMNSDEAVRILSIFWGIYLLGGYVPVLVSKKFYTIIMGEKQEDGFVISAASMQLIIGAASLAAVNEWEWGPAVVITLLGWTAVAKGVGRYLALGFAKKAAERMPLYIAYPYTAVHLLAGFYLLASLFLR